MHSCRVSYSFLHRLRNIALENTTADVLEENQQWPPLNMATVDTDEKSSNQNCVWVIHCFVEYFLNSYIITAHVCRQQASLYCNREMCALQCKRLMWVFNQEYTLLIKNIRCIQ